MPSAKIATRGKLNIIAWLLAFVLGIAGAVIYKMVDRGLVTGNVLLSAPAGVLLLSVFAFFGQLWRSKNFDTFVKNFFLGALKAAALFLLSLITWIVASQVMPDLASIHFRLRQAYIESHWRTDPITGIIYFPIDYTGVGEKEDRTIAPRNFYVLDTENKFVISEFSDRLKSPSCPNAKYDAKRLGNGVYAVRMYVDDPAELSVACLVTASPRTDK